MDIQILSLDTKTRTAIIFFCITLIIFTPLCGWLFGCGCTWPGLGLDVKCNYHQLQADHKCPWCVSLQAGVISYFLALSSSLRVLWRNVPRKYIRWEFGYRLIIGNLTFLTIAAMCGWLVAITQSFPLN